MGIIEQFGNERLERVKANAENENMVNAANDFMRESTNPKYSYNFSWMGRPIIQYPQDMIAMQEIIWDVRPDLIIEAGIAHGGSLIFYASILELIGKGSILGIDIDIRKHNRAAIEAHSMFKRIAMIEGSSVSEDVIMRVRQFTKNKETVLVVLDSNHTYEHVLAELQAYAPLVSKGSYCVVFDTIIDDLPDDMFPDRPWGKGNNPKTAVREYLKSHKEFEIDKTIQNKLLITVAPDGYLKRVR
jgi:cephalosporin hydroxylase